MRGHCWGNWPLHFLQAAAGHCCGSTAVARALSASRSIRGLSSGDRGCYPRTYGHKAGAGGGGIAVRECQIQLRKIAEDCGKFVGKLRCRNPISRSLKEQYFCTGDTQGTNKHAMWTIRKKLLKKCAKLREIAKITKKCEIAKNCGPQFFPIVAQSLPPIIADFLPQITKAMRLAVKLATQDPQVSAKWKAVRFGTFLGPSHSSFRDPVKVKSPLRNRPCRKSLPDAGNAAEGVRLECRNGDHGPSCPILFQGIAHITLFAKRLTAVRNRFSVSATCVTERTWPGGGCLRLAGSSGLIFVLELMG